MFAGTRTKRRAPARKLARTVAPTGVERSLGPDDIIVTKTDVTGRITYANQTFLTIAALTEDQAIGAPHSLIRHPDMPRCVFALLWRTIEAGNEIFAYVNNLAADGAHYWVFAHVTPTFGPDGAIVGYHSNRRRPRPEAVAAIEPLYGRLLAIERAIPDRKSQVEASTAELARLLGDAGKSYDEFIFSLAD
jgi:PAS domain S-box-containing protein